MRKGWLYILLGLVLVSLGLAFFLYTALAPEGSKAVDALVDFLEILFFTTPLGLALLLFGFFVSPVPKGEDEVAVGSVALSGLLGSKKDLPGL